MLLTLTGVLLERSVSIPTHALRLCLLPLQCGLLASSVFAWLLTTENNCPQTEYRGLYLAPAPNQQHYQGNSDHGLPELQCLYNLARNALTTPHFRHPNGWLAHQAIKCQVFLKASGLVPHVFFHHLKVLSHQCHHQGNARHPWQYPLGYQVSSHQPRQFSLATHPARR